MKFVNETVDEQKLIKLIADGAGIAENKVIVITQPHGHTVNAFVQEHIDVETHTEEAFAYLKGLGYTLQVTTL